LRKNNKTALITGSNRGLGLQLLQMLSANGYNVIACTRSKSSSFSKIIDEVSKKNNNKIYNLSFDLLNHSDTESSLTQFLNNYEDNVDLLINNAGILKNSLMLMTSIKEVEDIFKVNVISTILVTQIVVKKMIKYKKGNILNISSISAKENNFGRSIYSSSKSAIESITKSLSKEFSRFNVRVNCIAPGLIDSEMLKKNTTEENINKVIRRIASQRLGTFEDICKLILFLASEDSNYINGQILSIDGGIYAD
jgi:3-oxoacyl-[acyl-carrier protein] reductase